MQALAAASKTVDSLKIVHSLHVYFLLVGDLESKPCSIYQLVGIIRLDDVSFRLSLMNNLGEMSDKCMLALQFQLYIMFIAYAMAIVLLHEG